MEQANTEANPHESCRAITRTPQKRIVSPRSIMGRGEHDKGYDQSTKARRHSTDAHAKSPEHRTKK
jgi:hypothetical protein